MTILLFHWLRHAPPINPDDLCYGENIPVDLSDRTAFERQLKRLPTDGCWHSSDMPRAVQTASRFLDIRGAGKVLFIKRNGFNEQSFGDWSGKPKKELFNDVSFKNYIADPLTVRPPQGENLHDLSTRVTNEIQNVIHDYPDCDRHTIVTHAGVIRVALSQSMDISLPDALRIQIDPLSLTVISYDTEKSLRGNNPWRLVHLNITP